MISAKGPRRTRCRISVLFVASVTASLWIVIGSSVWAWAVPLSSGPPRPSIEISPRTAALPRTVRAAAFHDQAPAKDIDGADFSFDQLKGKVVYAVNVASR